jgi:DNA-binding CsgD family transcriptional regulator
VGLSNYETTKRRLREAKGKDVRRSKKNPRAGSTLEPVIDPALERPLLNLHRAMDVNSFWRAVQRVLSVATPQCVIGLTFRRNPALPVIARWTRPIPHGFFAVEPLKSYLGRPERKKFVRLRNLFRNRSSFVRSVLYRRYIAPQKCAYGLCLLLWKGQRLICGMAILRPSGEGDFSRAEIKLLRELYPQFLTALCRIESLEHERSVRMDFEEFLKRLPLPTIILQWNLKPIYLNWAAREFCAVWEKGPEEAKRTKALAKIPSPILDRCRLLKRQWTEAGRRTLSDARTFFKEQQAHHPRLPHYRATIQLRHPKSAGVVRPHFLIECEDLSCNGNRNRAPANLRLPAITRLTTREQEVARLVCNGQSNKEIADTAHLSVAMVKKHTHAIFRKLEVPCRSRLVALML